MAGVLEELALGRLLQTLKENLLACPKAAALNDPEFSEAVRQFLSDPRVRESLQILGGINRELCEWLDVLPAVAGMASPILTDMLENEKCREYMANLLLSGSRLLREFLAVAVAKK
jgi:hypothetical protein